MSKLSELCRAQSLLYFGVLRSFGIHSNCLAISTINCTQSVPKPFKATPCFHFVPTQLRASAIICSSLCIKLLRFRDILETEKIHIIIEFSLAGLPRFVTAWYSLELVSHGHRIKEPNHHLYIPVIVCLNGSSESFVFTDDK